MTSITLQNMEFINLNGIESCKKLKNFSAIDARVKDYSPLSFLTNIEEIYIQGSGALKDKDLENLINSIKSFKKLIKLSLYATNLEDISLLDELKNIDSLKNLNLGVNKIKNLEPLKNLTNLKYLDLRNNLIFDISPLKSLTKLETLYLMNNDIIDITPLASNKNLVYLSLKNNPKIDGDRNNYDEQGIKDLDEIGKILDRNGTIYLDSEQLDLFHNYRNINLSNENLSTLDILDGMTQIENLNLGGNKLTLEDEKSQEILSSMKNLKYLYLENNQLTDISAINNLKNLNTLYIMGNENINLGQIEDIISNLANLRLGTNALKTITNCNPTKIEKLNIDNSVYITEIPDLSKLTSLKRLSLASLTGVNDFSFVSNLNSLTNLTLNGNNLHNKMPDLSKLTNLQSISLSNCSLWSEDLENLKVLRNNSNLTINLSNNAIIDATTLLELNSNTKINLTGNINLSQDSKDKLKEYFGSNVTF